MHTLIRKKNKIKIEITLTLGCSFTFTRENKIKQNIATKKKNKTAQAH